MRFCWWCRAEEPSSFALIVDTKDDWNIRAKPGVGTNGRPVHLSRGKFLGGSSGCNGTLCVRGSKQDYDDWGVEGWNGDEMFKYMSKVWLTSRLTTTAYIDVFLGGDLPSEALVQGRSQEPRDEWSASYRTTRPSTNLEAIVRVIRIPGPAARRRHVHNWRNAARLWPCRAIGIRWAPHYCSRLHPEEEP